MNKVKSTTLRLFLIVLASSVVIGASEVVIQLRALLDGYYRFYRFHLPGLSRFVLYIVFPYGVAHVAWHFLGRNIELRDRETLLSVVVSLSLGSLFGYGVGYSVGWYVILRIFIGAYLFAEIIFFYAFILSFVSFAAVATKYLLTPRNLEDIRFLIIKATLEKFPELRKKVREYLEREEERL